MVKLYSVVFLIIVAYAQGSSRKSNGKTRNGICSTESSTEDWKSRRSRATEKDLSSTEAKGKGTTDVDEHSVSICSGCGEEKSARHKCRLSHPGSATSSVDKTLSATNSSYNNDSDDDDSEDEKEEEDENDKDNSIQAVDDDDDETDDDGKSAASPLTSLKNLLNKKQKPSRAVDPESRGGEKRRSFVTTLTILQTPYFLFAVIALLLLPIFFIAIRNE